MKKLVFTMAVPAALLLAASAEAADRQLEVGILTYAQSAPAPYVVVRLQPATRAPENSHTLVVAWRNVS